MERGEVLGISTFGVIVKFLAFYDKSNNGIPRVAYLILNAPDFYASLSFA
jgi:hypothetical protein